MMVKLGDLGQIITGNTPKTNEKHNYNSKDICFVKPSDIDEENISLIEKSVFYISERARNKSKIVPKNSILVTCIGIIGKVAITNVECAFNQQINGIVLEESKCIPNYVAYAIQFQKKYIQEVANNAVVPILNKTQFSNIEISLPLLEEQRKIAKILDKVSDLIAKRKQQLEKLDLLVKSRFIEMFGDPFVNPKSWNIVVFSDIIQNANNGMARRGNDLDGDIVLRLVELQNGYIDYSSPNRIILNEAEKKRYRLLDKDFLFARVNGNPDNVGRCAVFNDIKDPVYHNDHIIRVHFNDELVNGTFLSVLLNSEYGKSEMRNKIKTSAGQYTISQDGIGAVKSILPPIKLQTQFAEFVQQTEHTKSIIKQSLEKLETLKKELMQEYFG